MQDGEEANLRTHAFGICGDLQLRLGACRKEQIVESGWTCQGQRVEFVGHGEDDMKVVGVKQIALLSLDPTLAGLRLALGTATRSAGVVGDGCFVLAVDTLVLMPAQSRGTATQHSPKCLQLLKAEDGLEALQKVSALGTDDVGHLDGRLAHE